MISQLFVLFGERELLKLGIDLLVCHLPSLFIFLEFRFQNVFVLLSAKSNLLAMIMMSFTFSVRVIKVGDPFPLFEEFDYMSVLLFLSPE